jgi:hypothetical protein
MLYSVELFPPVNYVFGPMEACFSVAPAFVDAMLPTPFLHEFQLNCPFFSCFYPNTFMNHLQGGIMHKDKLFNTKKARIPDHFMSWSPCWWK